MGHDEDERVIWWFALLVVTQIPLLTWSARLFARRGLGFFSLFHLEFTIALLIPFLVIFCYASGWFDLMHILGVPPSDRKLLPFGGSPKPVLFILLAHSLFVIGAMAVTALDRRLQPAAAPIRALDAAGWSRHGRFALACLAIALGYIAVRAVLVPDFPLFVLLGGSRGDSRLRDIAYAYGSNRNAPWIFLPSIHSQFYRILLPLSALSLLGAWRFGGRKPWVFACAVAALAASFGMSCGTLKRTPLIYLFFWIGCWWCLQRPFTRRMALRVALSLALLAAAMVAITSGYGERQQKLTSDAVWGNLVSRVVYGESVSDYLAVQHHPGTFPHRGIGLFSPYVAKMMGQKNARSFSQTWKMDYTKGTGRGFDAVGAFTEWFVAFGWTAAALVSLLFGATLAWIDCRLLRRGIADDERPFIAGLVSVVASMSVKGMLAQFFTGGACVILAAYLIWKYVRKQGGSS